MLEHREEVRREREDTFARRRIKAGKACMAIFETIDEGQRSHT